MGYRKISNTLNRSGIKTHRGNTFTNSSIHSILKRKKEQDKRDKPYCSKPDDETDNLNWSWGGLDKLLSKLYVLVLLSNILLLCDNYFMAQTILFVFVYLILILLGVKNYNSVGNLWCFISPTMIIVLLIIQTIFPELASKKINL